MISSKIVYKPNMAALEGPIGRSIYEAVRDAPEPDWAKISAESKALDLKLAEALKNAAS